MLSHSDSFACLYTISTLPEAKCWVELVFKITLATVNVTGAGKGLEFE